MQHLFVADGKHVAIIEEGFAKQHQSLAKLVNACGNQRCAMIAFGVDDKRSLAIAECACCCVVPGEGLEHCRWTLRFQSVPQITKARNFLVSFGYDRPAQAVS